MMSQESMELWHQRFGHVSKDILQHLEDGTQGGRVTTESYDEGCVTCKQSKAKQRISRRPRQRSIVPYERIHFDLIPMNEGDNGGQWVAHFQCDYTRMHHVYILANKRQESVLNTITDMV